MVVFTFYINGGNIEKRFAREFIRYICGKEGIDVTDCVKWEECTRKRLVVVSRRVADCLRSINQQVCWPNGEIFKCKIVRDSQFDDGQNWRSSSSRRRRSHDHRRQRSHRRRDHRFQAYHHNRRQRRNHSDDMDDNDDNNISSNEQRLWRRRNYWSVANKADKSEKRTRVVRSLSRNDERTANKKSTTTTKSLSISSLRKYRRSPTANRDEFIFDNIDKFGERIDDNNNVGDNNDALNGDVTFEKHYSAVAANSKTNYNNNSSNNSSNSKIVENDYDDDNWYNNDTFIEVNICQDDDDDYKEYDTTMIDYSSGSSEKVKLNSRTDLDKQFNNNINFLCSKVDTLNV
nr:lef-6 [Calliteara abietis nucleopolyhedrovirus]